MSNPLPDGFRDRVELDAAYIAAKNENDHDDFVAGAIAGYEWVLGLTAAPISGETATITVQLVRREEQLADDAIYKRRGAAEVRQDWAVGVQHALMWARRKADDPPLYF